MYVTHACVGVQVGVYSGVRAHMEARGLYVVLQAKATVLLETGSLVPWGFCCIGEAGWLVGSKGSSVPCLPAGFFPMSSGVVTQFARYSLYQLGYLPSL